MPQMPSWLVWVDVLGGQSFLFLVGAKSELAAKRAAVKRTNCGKAAKVLPLTYTHAVLMHEWKAP